MPQAPAQEEVAKFMPNLMEEYVYEYSDSKHGNTHLKVDKTSKFVLKEINNGLQVVYIHYL